MPEISKCRKLLPQHSLPCSCPIQAAIPDFRRGYRILECAEIPAGVKEKARGICRVREGYTVLLPAEAGAEGTREATLEEIMVHLEKEGEDA